MVTFCLADAWQLRDLATWKGLTPREKRILYEHTLDAAYGKCWLRLPAIAEVVVEAILWRDGREYDLCAWVVMANHVHLVFRQRDGWPLAVVMRRLKSYSALQANRLLGRSGAFWGREYWDTMLKFDEHLERAVQYVICNPVNAGVVDEPQKYRYSSAYVPGGLE